MPQPWLENGKLYFRIYDEMTAMGEPVTGLWLHVQWEAMDWQMGCPL